MAAKRNKTTPTQPTDTALTSSVKDSAQQIWQAGLGAFNKAQIESSKAFETLASDISSKASGQWGKLENIFEDRVAKALNKLGMPSVREFNALTERVNELNLIVKKLSAKRPAAQVIVRKVTPKKMVKTITQQEKI
jgi:hypothetical protein